MKKVLTLCIVWQGSQVLLGMKKRGFGAGRWNGFGGKVEEGESIEAAAKRELREEVGLEALEMAERGVIEFEIKDDPKIHEVHVFHVMGFNGTPNESEEMRPQWFSVEEIPFEQMWPADKYWIPLFLKGKKFKGRIFFDRASDAEHTSEILGSELIELEG